MAKLTEIIVAVEAEGVNEVLSALKQVDGAQATLASNTKQSATDQASATQSAKVSWQQMATGINQAMQIANTAIKAGKAVYNFANEGAQLDYVASKFDNLTESIGTSSFALMNDLRNATGGTVSDAKLMESATDMMSLGLAKTHDETVRLTSVAGQLGMNMDQLTLTLTNQTTKRFDTLGVSVAGFDERLEGLKATGLSTQDAFTEAFLQQAEEQIDRVGGISETSAGSFMKLGAAFEQMGANMKQNFSAQVVPAVDGLAGAFGRIAEIGVQEGGIKDLAEQLDLAGVNTAGFYEEVNSLRNAWGNLSNEDYTAIVEKYSAEIETATQGTQNWADANYDSADAASAAEQAIADMVQAQQDLNLVSAESVAVVQNVSAGYDALTLDFKSMQSMAYGYDDALTLIADNEAKIEQLRPFAETGGELDGVKMSAEDVQAAIAALEGSSEDAAAAMDKMAKEMTLSMMQASMGVDGYTQSEIDSLTQYMVDAGLISAEAAEKMKADYAAAINYANKLELEQKVGEILANVEGYEEGVRLVGSLLIDNKTGKVLADTSEYMDGLTAADLAELDPKVGEILADIMPYLIEMANLPDPEAKEVPVTVTYSDPGFTPRQPGSVNVPVNYIAQNRIPMALGGAVYPGQEYMWQEQGREGELFIPEKYGRVMNQAEVAQLLREAFTSDKPTARGSNQREPVINNYYYSLTMPTTSNPADVRTAFELMEAWN
jgi:hypothetical protein